MIFNVVNTLKLIVSAPINQSRRIGALKDWFMWQLGARLVDGSVEVPFVNDSVLMVDAGMTGATGNIYLGLAEFEDMGFLLHFLEPDDLFVDIGANIGSFTVLAGKAVGSSCVSIEALPATYYKLLKNIKVNDISTQVDAVNCAVGSENGVIHFTSGLDTMNHVVSDVKDTMEDVCSVDVRRLDDILSGRVPRMIKIDVEGYETPVIDGAQKTLLNFEQDVVIMELNGCGVSYGFDDDVLHKTMLSIGYCAISYNPMTREILNMKKPNKTGNTIYIKKVKFLDVAKKLKAAKTFLVKGQNI